MRLESLMTRQPLRYRLLLTMIRLTSGEASDILRLLMYRPTFFGQPFTETVEQYLRGSSEWSVSEREAMAVAISESNNCPFCARSHRAILESTESQVTLDTLAGAQGSSKLHVALILARRLTSDADGVTEADIAPLQAAGISEAGIQTVIGIATIFNMINRIANSLDFALPANQEARKTAKGLLVRSYRI